MQQRKDVSFRAVRDAVLDRDGHKCECGRFAATVRYLNRGRRPHFRPDADVRLNPDLMGAVCGPCQVVTPVDRSGEYRPKRRGRRNDNRGGRKAKAA